MVDPAPGQPLRFMLITSSPEVAKAAESAGVDRIFVDLEVLGKRERQQGRSTVISGHTLKDVAAVAGALQKAELLVRVNPLHPGTLDEVNRAIESGADLLMLPMFRSAQELDSFCRMVGGRVGVIALVETPEAVKDIEAIAKVPGLAAVHIGLNDLSLALGMDFLFEPLASGMIDHMAQVLRDAKIPYGFGGVARVGQGMLPAELVLGEHVRADSSAVILSRAFHGGTNTADRVIVERLNLSEEIAQLRSVVAKLRQRTPEQVEQDRVKTKRIIEKIAADSRKTREGGA
jgi:2-keto-3-deoxy-L-rhamnonate aldolase RhmA